MKKVVIAIVAIVVVVALVIGAVVLFGNNNNTNTPSNNNASAVKLETSEDMIALVEKIYEKSGNDMFGLETRALDLTDEMALPSYTGLSSAKDLDTVVVSESMITSTAFQLALVKVKDGVNVESIKQEMVDNLDMRKWICVCADFVYATNYNNVIFVVMAAEDYAKPQLDAFKSVVGGNTGKDVVREAEKIEFDF